MLTATVEFDKNLLLCERVQMTRLPISLVIITLNEERQIKRCIKSASFCDDILVVDSFSYDRTKEQAESVGARVIQEKWRGFGLQKEFAAQQAKNDWILSLDADEALSSELVTEILSLFPVLDPEAGYLIPRKSFHLGRWIHHGGWYPDYQLRLYNRKYSSWDRSPIHEKINSKKKFKLNFPIMHWVFDDLSDQVMTNNRYSSLQADQLYNKGRKFGINSFINLLTKPISKFIETYFWKRGFLDGMPGFIISVSASYSVFLKWSKLWELDHSSRDKASRDKISIDSIETLDAVNKVNIPSAINTNVDAKNNEILKTMENSNNEKKNY